ncbi:MAG: hypothetical protein M3250_00275 [Thermoproteota archaeon]|nr:hypothetical protein [Thermoproteota archaeon]
MKEYSNNNNNIPLEQRKYIESITSGIATSSRTICKDCDERRHDECSTRSDCYCAKNGHRIL